MNCSSQCCCPKSVAFGLLRVSFGLSLLFIGIAHIRDAVRYADMVSAGLQWPWLTSLGSMWGYVLPVLLIVGGFCIALGIFATIGTWAAGLALASIPAGLMLKAALGTAGLDIAMPGTINAFLWILLYVFAVKSMKRGCCGLGCGAGMCSMCGKDPCACSVKSEKKSAPVAKKTVAKAAAPKKVVAKKA